MRDRDFVEVESDTITGIARNKASAIEPITKNNELVIAASVRPDADIYLNPDYRLVLVENSNGAHYRIVQK